MEVLLKVQHLEYNKKKSRQQIDPEERVMSYVTNNLPLPKTQRILQRPPSSSYSLQELRDIGFTTKGKQVIWTDDEKRLVEEALKKYAVSDHGFDKKSPHYYISHHVLSKSKSENDVKRYLDTTYGVKGDY